MKSQKNAKKNYTKILLIISILIIASITIALVLSFLNLSKKELYSQNYYASVNISEKEGGFDVNGTALTFGKMAVGGSSTRSIIFENGYNFPVYLEISATGNISPLLRFENRTEAEALEVKKIGISAISTGNESVGFYEGFVKMKVYPLEQGI